MKFNNPPSGSSHSFSGIKEYLGLNRNIGVLAISTFGLALGEELWLAFLPKYLVALGASGFAVGLFSSTKDLLDGLYQYPGGWVGDHYGRKRALMAFTMVAMTGYAVAALSFHWAWMFLAIIPIMGWKSGAFPVSFAVIGDSLPPGKRGIAFSVQSILQRLPRVPGAPLGGLLISALGVTAGIRTALVMTILLGIAVLIAQKRGYVEERNEDHKTPRDSWREVYARLPATLKRLLVVECIIRTGEAIAAAFIVLYVTDVLRVSVESYGLLFALQQSVAILMYLPSGKLADVTGRTPIIALTFLSFALFPLAIFLAHSLPLLLVAFFIGGLKEFGEPARKSFIVDQVDGTRRARAVGLYYTIRNLVIVPAGAVGGLLWQQSPHLPLLAACGVGLVGVFLFLTMTRRLSAS